MKKKIFITVLALLLFTNTLQINASTYSSVTTFSLSKDTTISPFAEQTVWYNRIYNGKLQQRLWSITYGKWLTEWEDVE